MYKERSTLFPMVFFLLLEIFLSPFYPQTSVSFYTDFLCSYKE